MRSRTDSSRKALQARRIAGTTIAGLKRTRLPGLQNKVAAVINFDMGVASCRQTYTQGLITLVGHLPFDGIANALGWFALCHPCVDRIIRRLQACQRLRLAVDHCFNRFASGACPTTDVDLHLASFGVLLLVFHLQQFALIVFIPICLRKKVTQNGQSAQHGNVVLHRDRCVRLPEKAPLFVERHRLEIG